MDCSLPGSYVHGISQARILEWLPFPTPSNLPDPGIKPVSLQFLALAGGFFTTCTTEHSSTLAWKIPWMEEPGRLQSMGSLRVGHDWATSLSHLGEGNGNPLRRSCLENPRDGASGWAESDTTEVTQHQQHHHHRKLPYKVTYEREREKKRDHFKQFVDLFFLDTPCPLILNET